MGIARKVVLFLMIASIAGCGTYANLYPQSWLVAGDFPEVHKDEKPEAFGGIRRDLDKLPLGAFDLPFSFLGDLITLPIMVPVSQSNAQPR